MSLIDQLYGVAWAIRPEALGALCAIAERQVLDPEKLADAFHHGEVARQQSLRAVEARRGQRLDRTETVTRRGRVAVVPVVGPIVRYADLFSSASGATSIESLARDFTSALEDARTRAVLLAVDSPGGELAGVAELAALIYAARRVKPVWAYVSDLGASAGYWLASAAEQVIVAETAALGSIGVVAAVKDPARDKSGDIEFISSVSPRKRADPTTESGRTQLQELVDTLGGIFVEAVARHRGTDAETVAVRYGGGGLLVGRQAVEAGLGDRLGAYEQTLLDLEAQIDQDDQAQLAEAASEPAPAEAGRPRKVASVSGSLRASFTRFLTHLDPPDAQAMADALDGVHAGELFEAGTIPAPQPAPQEEQPMPENPTPLPIPTVQAGSEDSVPPAIAARLARLEADNRRLQIEKVEQAAAAFAAEQLRDGRALPAQEATIAALYMVLADDDERFGPAVRMDGTRLLRTGLLTNFFAAAPDRDFLAKEVLAVAGGRTLVDRAAATRRDAEAPASPEELAQLLSHSSIGRQILSEASSVTGHSYQGPNGRTN